MHKLSIVSTLGAAAFFVPGAAAAVHSAVTGTTLAITSDAGDAIAVTCPSGTVLVNGANPNTGAAPCAPLTQLTIAGGPGANVIDTRAVVAAQFPALTTLSIDGGDGADVVHATLDLPTVDVHDTGATGVDGIDVTGTAAGDTFYADDTFLTRSLPGTGDHMHLTGIENRDIDAAGGDDFVALQAGTWIVEGGPGDDTLAIQHVDAAGTIVDGGPGADEVDAAFTGPLADWAGTILTVSDGGSDGAIDTVAYNDCATAAANGAGTRITDGAKRIDLTGIETTRCDAGTGLDWPQCGAGTATDCIVSATLDGGALPPYLELHVMESGEIQIELRNTDAPDTYDVASGLHPLSLTSQLTLTLDIGARDPGALIGAADIVSETWTLDPVHGNTVTLVTRPIASSWLFDGCTLIDCGTDTTRANSDYNGIVLLFLDTSGTQPAYEHGAWVATNAQALAPPTYDPATSSLQFAIAAPHLTFDPARGLNQGFFRAFLPDALLTSGFGIADPSSVTASTLRVTQSSGGSTTTATPTVTRVAGGVLVSLPYGSFHYSAPTFAIAKAPPSPTPPPAPTPAPSGSSSSESPTPTVTTQTVTPPAPPTTPVESVTAAAPPVVLPQPLVLETLLPKTVDLSQKQAVTLTVDTSAEATVHVVLLLKGKAVAQWTKVVGASAAPLSLGLPAKAQKPGSYTLSVTTSAGGKKVVRKSTLKLVA